MNLKKFISGVSALTIAASAFAAMTVTASAAVGTPAITGAYAEGKHTWKIDGHAEATELTSREANSYSATAVNPDDETDSVALTFVTGSDRNNSGGINRWDGLMDGGIYFARSTTSAAGNVSGRYITVVPSKPGTFSFDLTGTRVYGGRNDYKCIVYVNDVTGVDGSTFAVTTDNKIYEAATYNGSFTKTGLTYQMSAGHKYVFTWIGGNTTNNTLTFSNLTYEAADIATYTITTQYVDEADVEIRTATTATVEEGTEYIPTYPETIDTNAVSYTYLSNETIDSVSEDATVKVVYSATAKDPVQSITVKYVNGETDIDSTSIDVTDKYIGNSATIPFRKYIMKDGKLYEVAANSGTYFGETVTLEADTVVIKEATVVTPAEGTSFVALYDGEGDSGNNANVRASNMAATRDDIDLGVVEPGIYTIQYNQYIRGGNPTLYLDDEAVEGVTLEKNTNGWGTATTENITISKTGTLTIKNVSMTDWVLLIKTGDIETPAEPSATVTDTTNVKTFDDGYEGTATAAVVYVTYANANGSTITLSYADRTPAELGTEFTGDGNVVVAAVIANAVDENPIFTAAIN